MMNRISHQSSGLLSKNLLKARRCGEPLLNLSSSSTVTVCRGSLRLHANNCNVGTRVRLYTKSNKFNHNYLQQQHQQQTARRKFSNTKNNNNDKSNNISTQQPPQEKITLTESQAAALAQRRAYEYYRQKAGIPKGTKQPAKNNASTNNNTNTNNSSDTLHDRNTRLASYAAAVVIGALGATYAAVPLYKIFCQTTGFGGTTQRVNLTDWASTKEERDGSGRGKVSQALWDKLLEMSNVPREMLPGSESGSSSHGRGAKTWTDEEAAAKLASLRPCKDGQLITIRFDSTIGDVLPWSFVPSQLDVKVVPGETALSFFTATNHSDKAITGVATYNVHPPKVGLYFNKIQCFCFEEQRLLPGETVDMPVFFFIDPDIMEDPQLKNTTNVTLSYTFFQTDMDYEDEDEEEEEDEEVEEGIMVGADELKKGQVVWWRRLVGLS